MLPYEPHPKHFNKKPTVMSFVDPSPGEGAVLHKALVALAPAGGEVPVQVNSKTSS